MPVVVVAASPVETAAWLVDDRLLLAALAVNISLLALRLFAALDAWRIGALGERVPALMAAGAIGVLTAAPHVALGYMTVRSEVTLQRVFAEEEPSDVLPSRGVFVRTRDFCPSVLPRSAPLPAGRLFAARDVLVSADTPLERPWVTILLLGSDEGPGQPGDRTDTMILVGLERDTGRAVAFGIPRNLVNVRLVGRAGAELRRYPDLLNALYRFAKEERPDLFPGGRDPGATALKQTISRLLGLRVDYHAMVDLDGFAADVPQGGEFQVNVGPAGAARAYVGLATDGAGTFIVAWAGGPPGESGVWGRRLDVAGAPLGAETRLLEHTTNESPVRLAAGPAGNFMVINPWEGRVFDAAGAPLTPAFLTEAYDGGIAAAREGNFIVASAGYPDVTVRRYDPSGQPITGITKINQTPAGEVVFNDPSIAADAAGDFVVVWSVAYEYFEYPYNVVQGVFGRRLSVCGDGRVGPLACDDDNATGFDGCGTRCEVDSCFTCAGEPSTCAPIAGCATVCSGGAAIDLKTTAVFKRLGAPAGDEGLSFKARVLEPPFAPGEYDPMVAGAEASFTSGTLVYGLSVPSGPIGSGCGLLDGWKRSGRTPNFTYTYKNLTNALPPACVPGSANGLRVVKVKDKLARDGTLAFEVTLKNATLPPLPMAELTASIVLGQSPAAGTAGRCARVVFPKWSFSPTTGKFSLI